MILKTTEDFLQHRISLLKVGMEHEEPSDELMQEIFRIPAVPQEIATLGWIPVPDDDYDPLDFSDAPALWGNAQDLAVSDDTLYVAGSDGQAMHFFKYTRAKENGHV